VAEYETCALADFVKEVTPGRGRTLGLADPGEKDDGA
jgi:hypothetical protein